MLVAVLDALIPIFIGTVITLMATHGPDRLLAEAWPQLAGMAAVLVIVRPIAITTQNLITQQGISANFTSMIRWQGHFHVVRQGWAFFQEDFAGRIATRVMQAGPALRESVVQGVNAVWYILVYGSTALIWLTQADAGWRCRCSAGSSSMSTMLRFLVPRMRDRSQAASAERVAADRAHRRQLHQHPDGEAVRAGRGGGQLHPRRRRPADRGVPPADAAGHAERAAAVER